MATQVTQINLTGLPDLYGIDIFSEKSVQSHPLGAIGYDQAGRRFRYCHIGASNLVAGHLLQNSARDTNFTDMAVQAAVALSITTIPITLGGTSTTADMFAEGFMAITANTGAGYTYPIKGNAANTNGTTCNFELRTGVKIALDTTTTVTTMKNPYDGVIDSPTTATGISVGVANFVQTAAYYSWIGVQGYFAVLASTTVPAIGGGVEAKNSSTAGSVNILASANYQIGGAPILGVSAEYQIVYLTLP